MIFTKIWEEFPGTKGRSFVIETEDGDHVIVINPKMSWHQQRKSYIHEVRHIRRDDLRKGDVQTAEMETHEG